MKNPYRKGELKAKMTYTYVGEIREATIKRTASYKAGIDDPVSDTYYVVLRDGEGLQQSLYRYASTYEAAERLRNLIPLCKTIVATGKVCIRRNNIYFETLTLSWPNGDNILVWAMDKEIRGSTEEDVA
jgi:hypothetical protein